MKEILRIIPVLFIKNGLIVRSQNFQKHQFIGNVIEQAKRLNDYNVDELVYIDITRNNNYDMGRDDLLIKSQKGIMSIIKEISKVCFMPLTFGGGIRSVEDAVNRIRAGADKIVINSLLFKDLDLVKKIISEIGSQAVVASLDYKIIKKKLIIFNNFGKNNTKMELINFLKKIENLGVGEFFIQNIDLDGLQKGFDIKNIKKIVNSVNLPVIACSGAGSIKHFLDAVKIKGLSAVAAGNYFNYTERSYPLTKKKLKNLNINVR
jgi:imidazole glycerol-phosphate synthase subunit HisF